MAAAWSFVRTLATMKPSALPDLPRPHQKPALVKCRSGLYYARMDTPKSLFEVSNALVNADSVTFSKSEAETAKRLNSQLLDICARAIAQASEAPPAIRDWRDLKTAREIMAAASGTDVQKPLVNFIFPPALDGQSSELPSYIRLSDISAAKPHGPPAPASPDELDALPAVALHAIAAHERTLEATGRGAGGRTASA